MTYRDRPAWNEWARARGYPSLKRYLYARYWLDGRSPTEMAEETGRHRKWVIHAMIVEGVPRRTRAQAYRVYLSKHPELTRRPVRHCPGCQCVKTMEAVA